MVRLAINGITLFRLHSLSICKQCKRKARLIAVNLVKELQLMIEIKNQARLIATSKKTSFPSKKKVYSFTFWYVHGVIRLLHSRNNKTNEKTSSRRKRNSLPSLFIRISWSERQRLCVGWVCTAHTRII